MDKQQMNRGIQALCKADDGPLQSRFLCASVSVLDPPIPVVVRCDALVREVGTKLKENKVGCTLVVDDDGRLMGIMSERDIILKVLEVEGAIEKPVVEFMTPEPVAIHIDDTIAFSLMLMSQGGFRHLPIVDEENVPTGILSVKEVVDYLATEQLDSLLDMEEPLRL